MPKINNTHIAERIAEHIERMERGLDVEAKKDKTLLNETQQHALKTALEHQRLLKKSNKRPKTQAEKDAMGWKEIRQVRLDIYKQALQELNDSAVDDMLELQQKREAKGNRVFMDAWGKASADGKERYSAISAGNIALTRAGFTPQHSVGLTKRDRELRDMEDALLKQFAADMTEEERDQRAILKEHEDAQKRKKR
jgi:hypothetical protein